MDSNERKLVFRDRLQQFGLDSFQQELERKIPELSQQLISLYGLTVLPEILFSVSNKLSAIIPKEVPAWNYLFRVVVDTLMAQSDDLLFYHLTREEMQASLTVENASLNMWDSFPRQDFVSFLYKEVVKNMIEHSTFVQTSDQVVPYLGLYQRLFALWPELAKGANGAKIQNALTKALNGGSLQPINVGKKISNEQKSVTEKLKRLEKEQYQIPKLNTDSTDEDDLGIDFSSEAENA